MSQHSIFLVPPVEAEGVVFLPGTLFGAHWFEVPPSRFAGAAKF